MKESKELQNIKGIIEDNIDVFAHRDESDEQYATLDGLAMVLRLGQLKGKKDLTQEEADELAYLESKFVTY